jgi:hypothetical protein
MIELPEVREDGMSGRNVQRKRGTTRGSPRCSRTAKASRISRQMARHGMAPYGGFRGHRVHPRWPLSVLGRTAVILPPTLAAAIDAWASGQEEPGRSEAIRRLIELWAEGEVVSLTSSKTAHGGG